MIKRSLWVVETLIGGRWVPHELGCYIVRWAARKRAKGLRNAGLECRVARYFAMD